MQNRELTLVHVTSPAYRDLPDLAPGAAVLGFMPAFRDVDTEEVHLSVNEDGSPAAVHVLDHLPDHWVTERDQAGRIMALKEGIIAGFMRHARFFTRAELARLPWDA